MTTHPHVHDFVAPRVLAVAVVGLFLGCHASSTAGPDERDADYDGMQFAVRNLTGDAGATLSEPRLQPDWQPELVDGEPTAGPAGPVDHLGAPAPPPAETVLRALAARSCGILRRCEALLAPERREELAGSCAPELLRASGDGRTYDPAMGRACLDALTEETLEGCHPRPPLPDPCAAAVHGSIPQGSPCDSSAACQWPLICLGAAAHCSGQCQSTRVLGARCALDSDCDRQARCLAGTCVPASCRDDFDCASGELCTAEHACAERPGVDETCVPVDGISPCADDLACGGTPGFWTCTTGAAAGWPCVEDDCPDGIECVRTPCAVGLRCAGGSCLQVADVAHLGICNVMECPVGFGCNNITGRCVVQAGLGEPCAPGRCFEGLCQDGQCALGKVGDACSDDAIVAQCAGYCDNARCADHRLQGEDCTGDAQCGPSMVCDATCTPVSCNN